MCAEHVLLNAKSWQQHNSAIPQEVREHSSSGTCPEKSVVATLLFCHKGLHRHLRWVYFGFMLITVHLLEWKPFPCPLCIVPSPNRCLFLLLILLFTQQPVDGRLGIAPGTALHIGLLVGLTAERAAALRSWLPLGKKGKVKKADSEPFEKGILPVDTALKETHRRWKTEKYPDGDGRCGPQGRRAGKKYHFRRWYLDEGESQSYKQPGEEHSRLGKEHVEGPWAFPSWACLRKQKDTGVLDTQWSPGRVEGEEFEEETDRDQTCRMLLAMEPRLDFTPGTAGTGLRVGRRVAGAGL